MTEQQHLEQRIISSLQSRGYHLLKESLVLLSSLESTDWIAKARTSTGETRTVLGTVQKGIGASPELCWYEREQ